MSKWEPIDRSLDNSPDLIFNISKWRFRTARLHLDDRQPENVRVAVRALAKSFENCGYMYGAVGDVISCLVRAVLGDERSKRRESGAPTPGTPRSPAARDAVAMAGDDE